MDSPFPATPDMRYERMAMGLVASTVCFAIGLGFASTAWVLVHVALTFAT